VQKYSTPYRTSVPIALIICYLGFAFLMSCDGTKTKESLDTSHIKLQVEPIRYDQLFFQLDTTDLYASLDQLGKKHPNFTNLYTSTLAGFGKAGTPRFDTAIRQFLTLPDYRNLYDTVQKHFPDTKQLDQELETTFKNISYFFPEERQEEVFYFISGLNLWSAITIDSAIGVGLDMYLGEQFPFYASVQIPAYEIKNRVPGRIAVEVAKAIFEAKFPFEYEGKSLLEMMLYKGKELYFVEQVCRDKSEALIVGYTPKQAEWCKQNEEGVYYFFAKKELMYSTTWQDIMPFINDGPNTAGMPPEAPGNMGSWLGWQLVRNYMKQHPQESMSSLMKSKLPAQQFLRAAKYKP
jgi:hypothetical protein